MESPATATRRLCARGRRRYRQGRLRDAVGILSSAAEACETPLELAHALHLRALAYLALADWRAAAVDLANSLRVASASAAAVAHQQSAEVIQERLDDLAAAVRESNRRPRSSSPASADSPARRPASPAASGASPKASKSSKSLPRSPTSPGSLADPEGLVGAWSSDDEAAEAEYAEHGDDALPEVVPTDVARVFRSYGRSLAQREEWEAANEAFTEALLYDDMDWRCYLARGIGHMFLSRWDLALDDINVSIVLQPREAELFLLRARIYGQLRMPHHELAQMRALAERIPDHPALDDFYRERRHEHEARFSDAVAHLGRRRNSDVSDGRSPLALGSSIVVGGGGSSERPSELATASLEHDSVHSASSGTGVHTRWTATGAKLRSTGGGGVGWVGSTRRSGAKGGWRRTRDGKVEDGGRRRGEGDGEKEVEDVEGEEEEDANEGAWDMDDEDEDGDMNEDMVMDDSADDEGEGPRSLAERRRRHERRRLRRRQRKRRFAELAGAVSKQTGVTVNPHTLVGSSAPGLHASFDEATHSLAKLDALAESRTLPSMSRVASLLLRSILLRRRGDLDAALRDVVRAHQLFYAERVEEKMDKEEVKGKEEQERKEEKQEVKEKEREIEREPEERMRWKQLRGTRQTKKAVPPVV